MRWYTLTPRDFVGNEAFMARDSGLLCQGFLKLGVECRALEAGESREDDCPEVLRASDQELRSPEWWRQQSLDGVAFYSWASPKGQAIADALKSAGVPTIQMVDTHGVVSVISDPLAYLQTAWAHHWNEPILKRLARTIYRIPYGWIWRTLTRDPKRARMIATSEFLGAATPKSAERYRRLVSAFKGAGAGERVRMVPMPVGFHFEFPKGGTKTDSVVAVGRWDHRQKRAPLLMGTIRELLAKREGTVFRIFGRPTRELEGWHASLPDPFKERVKLEGLVPNSELCRAYQEGRVILVSAAYEGCHLASAEMLCSGGSVVACRSPFLNALEWHASRDSGRISERATPEALSDTLVEELNAWDAGERDPEAISRHWKAVCHPDRVAATILELFGQTVSSGEGAVVA